jgi:hypothetical protein
LWLFPVATAAHNLEEALWLPTWSRNAGLPLGPPGAFEFRLAVVALTILAVALTVGARRSGKWLPWAAAYWVAMLLNVLFPHVLLTLVLGRYTPGVVTAVLLNLPVNSYLLFRAVRERWLKPRAILIHALIGVPALMVSIPCLFAIGHVIKALF